MARLEQRSIYRQDPLMGGLLTVGGINVVLGSLANQTILVILGLITVGIGLSLRWIALYLRRTPYNPPGHFSPHG